MPRVHSLGSNPPPFLNCGAGLQLAEGLKDSINDLEELLLHFEKHRAGHGGVVVGEQCRYKARLRGTTPSQHLRLAALKRSALQVPPLGRPLALGSCGTRCAKRCANALPAPHQGSHALRSSG